MPQHKPDGSEWWIKRRYRFDPFKYTNAAEVDKEDLLQFFASWHVDPGMPLHLQDEQVTFTLDLVKSLDTSSLALIYAPPGGGKTFYRRWAARKIQEISPWAALEISNVAEHIPDPDNVTARDLALCVYKHICEQCTCSSTDLGDRHIEHIFQQCDRVIKYHLPDFGETKRLYVFIDDLDKLFDDKRTGARRNFQVFVAIVDFCRAAARRGGGEPLALRLFIPERLEVRFEKDLGIRQHRRIQRCSIKWSLENCIDVVERRLRACSNDRAPRIDHIHSLLTTDTLNAVCKWLRRQKSISPRCIIKTMSQLAQYAHSEGAGNDAIGVKVWKRFLRKNRPDRCDPNRPYPGLLFPLPGPRRRPWLAIFSVLLISAILYFNPTVFRIAKEMVLSLYKFVVKMIDWLAKSLDWIGAFILLTVFLASVGYFFRYLTEKRRSGQPLKLREYLQEIQQLIRRYLQ